MSQTLQKSKGDRARWRNFKLRAVNAVALGACTLAATAAVFILFSIFGYIVYRGAGYLTINFFTHTPLQKHIGMENCIIGSLILVSLASVVGVPMGMLCGIYLAEYGQHGWFSHTVRLVVDVMAGVPSIVVGLLAYQVFVLRLGNYKGFAAVLMRAAHAVTAAAHIHGVQLLPVVGLGTYSGWAGAMALAFIMCPIVARTTEEMLRLVPQQLREASVGLGASQAQTLLRVVLPTARAGIITGVTLAVARIAGETAPLMFTAFGNQHQAYSPMRPMPSLPLQVYEYVKSAERQWHHQAWAAILLLIAVVTVFNLMVRFVSRRRGAGR